MGAVEASPSVIREAVPRLRSWSGPALLGHGFRPFFLGAGLCAPMVLCVWLLALSTGMAPPSAFAPAQ